jgi:hypothetical protein
MTFRTSGIFCAFFTTFIFCNIVQGALIVQFGTVGNAFDDDSVNHGSFAALEPQGTRSFFELVSLPDPNIMITEFEISLSYPSGNTSVDGEFNLFGVGPNTSIPSDSTTSPGFYSSLASGTLFASSSGTFSGGGPVVLSFNSAGLSALSLAVNSGQNFLLGGIFTPTDALLTNSLFANTGPSFASISEFDSQLLSTPTAVPEPASLAFLGLIGSVAGFRSMRRAKKKVVA